MAYTNPSWTLFLENTVVENCIVAVHICVIKVIIFHHI